MPARRPTALKLLLGTARPDRTRREPQFGRTIPRAPAGLGASARRIWRDLARRLDSAGVLTEADGHALGLLAEALADYRAAMDVVARDGRTYECRTSAGSNMHRVRPEVALAADAWRRAARMMVEFGLTPASRGRIDLPPVGPPL